MNIEGILLSLVAITKLSHKENYKYEINRYISKTGDKNILLTLLKTKDQGILNISEKYGSFLKRNFNDI